MAKPIFISHAHADHDLAKAIADFLAIGLNITRKDFCITSVKGAKIPAGEDFIEYIRTELKEAKVIILLISENYLASHFCVAESGASWVLREEGRCKLIPIVVPPLTGGMLKATLAVTQSSNIADSDGWDDTKDAFSDYVGAKTSTAQWNEEKEAFLGKLADLIASLPPPSVVDPEKHEKLRARVEYLRTQKAELEGELEEKDNFIAALTEAENVDERQKILMDSLDEFEALEELGKKLGDAILELPNAAQDAVYYHAKSEDLPEPPFGYDGTDERWREIGEAVDLKILSSENPLSLNTDHPDVFDVIEALEELKSFLSENEDTLSSELMKKWRCTYDLADLAFWNHVTNP